MEDKYLQGFADGMRSSMEKAIEMAMKFTPKKSYQDGYTVGDDFYWLGDF